MRLPLVLALLLSTTPLLASPTITSVTPTEGPVTGGTSVTIRGFGFSTAGGPVVLSFGGVEAASMRVVDANTITAVTPRHLPGPATLFLSQPDDSARLIDGFLFTGNASDAFDRLLLPLLLPPIYGAYGSQFVTNLTLWNASLEDMPLYGLLADCGAAVMCAPAPHPPLPSRPVTTTSDFVLTGIPSAPGRFVYVPKGSGDLLAAELRVQDVSRQAQAWGTQIPVVPDREMRNSIVGLLDTPNDERFRNTLRVYGDQEGMVLVRIVRSEPPSGVVNEFMLHLAPGATMFDPSYASFSAFPPAPITAGPAIARLRVEITPATYLLRTWSFVSVTNNETQHITVITPH